MFPDTAQFTDPAYTDPNYETELYGGSSPIPTDDPAYQAMLSGNQISTSDPAYQKMLAGSGGAASNTPAQGSSTGASILGWLGLANNVANTAANASRTGYSTRPGVTKQTSSLGSFGGMTTATLLIIVAVFVGVVFLLKRK